MSGITQVVHLCRDCKSKMDDAITTVYSHPEDIVDIPLLFEGEGIELTFDPMHDTIEGFLYHDYDGG